MGGGGVGGGVAYHDWIKSIRVFSQIWKVEPIQPKLLGWEIPYLLEREVET